MKCAQNKHAEARAGALHACPTLQSHPPHKRPNQAPEEADAVLVVPLDDAGQGLGVLHGQRADVLQALLQEGLLDAVAVGEDGRPLLAQVHVQAGVPARACAAVSMLKSCLRLRKLACIFKKVTHGLF